MVALIAVAAFAAQALRAASDAGSAGSTYLNISNYATIADAGYKSGVLGDNGTMYSYDADNKVLVVSAFVAYQSAKTQKWVTTPMGSGSTSFTWDAVDVFKGSSFYGMTTAKAATTNTSRDYSFKVTNCKKVSALVISQARTRTITMTVYPLGDDLTTRGEAVGSASDNSNEVAAITVDNLDDTKIYEVYI